MPPQFALKGPEHLSWHVAEPRLDDIPVLPVVFDNKGKDMILPHFQNTKPPHQDLDVTFGVSVGNRTASLSLRLVQPRLNHDRLPGILGIEHQAKFRAWPHIFAGLGHDLLGPWGVVNDPERIDEVEFLLRQELR